MLGYDGLRLLRWLFPHSKFWVAVQDLLYWCIMSVPAFALFFYLHDGQIRWYGLSALLGGIVLYEFGISSPIRRALSKRLDQVRYRIRRGIVRFFRFLRKSCERLVSGVRKIVFPNDEKSEKENNEDSSVS
ncbi:MAG: spore cortex biosynthesis protein YabQ [Lachnospiraceae bacterium]|nr:spore cortex biosynthesis protein YabQ [Lachnospiraceae bacterium]